MKSYKNRIFSTLFYELFMAAGLFLLVFVLAKGIMKNGFFPTLIYASLPLLFLLVMNWVFINDIVDTIEKNRAVKKKRAAA